MKKELDGSGKDLGYRAMHNKIRQKHKLNVPREVVYAAMYELDPKGLENRGVGFNKKKRERETSPPEEQIGSIPWTVMLH